MRLVYALFMLFLWAVMAGGSSLVMDASANVKFLALAIMLAGAMAGCPYGLTCMDISR